MEDSIPEQLNLPPLAEPYAAALRSALSRIFEITTPLGVLVGGSVVQGKGDRTSDLDLYVLHGEPWRQRLQLRFDGVPCEIFVNPPAAIEGYLRTEAGERRPITAHLLATAKELAKGVDTQIRRAEEILADFPKGKVPYKAR